MCCSPVEGQQFRNLLRTVQSLSYIVETPFQPTLKVVTILDHKVEGGINICTNDMIKDINAMAMMPLEEKKKTKLTSSWMPHI